jgi:hypothetical protein
MGCYTSVGFGFTGSSDAKGAVQELLSLLQPLQATRMGDDGRGVGKRRFASRSCRC